MTLKKLRDGFVEAKLYFVRAGTYLNIFNFFMISLIFLNTTIWEYDFFQQLFPDRKIFLLLGFVLVLITVAVIGFVDTKYKLWRTESEHSLLPDRNPLMPTLALLCAKTLADMKSQGKKGK